MQVKVDIDTKKLAGLGKQGLQRQTPLILQSALNNLAFWSQDSTRKHTRARLRLTRAFVPQSIVVNKAGRNNPVAVVGFDARVPLIGLMEEGGTRRPESGKVIAAPIKVKRSAKGGITKANRPARVLQRKNTFSGRIGNTGGIWQRIGRKGAKRLSLLYVYTKRTRYKPGTIDFRDTVLKVARRRYSRALAEGLDRAVRRIAKG